MTAELRPFHLALPVNDLMAAESFYCELLGCTKGRIAERWIDLDFFGHQVTLHLVNEDDAKSVTNQVDGDAVPASHFGVVLDWHEWQPFADHLKAKGCDFLLPPRTRFEGQKGEQATFFITDPSGNALEFKSFADSSQLFTV